MIPFDPQNPFPLVPESSQRYADAQAHAAAVDRWLGLRVEEIEEKLRGKPTKDTAHHELWLKVPAKTFLTPYTELRAILAELKPQPRDLVVDLGAGYGRLGFVIVRHYPEVRFLGYEIVEERVREGNRCLRRFSSSAGELIQEDLSAPGFVPEVAPFYFLYDFGTSQAIDKTLEDLRKIASQRSITVVGRGRASRDAIERGHPWLSQMVKPRHTDHYSIYFSS